MTCDICREDNTRLRCVGTFTWACPKCMSNATDTESTHAFGIVDTVNYKYYYFNGGNVPKSRVDMIKRRTLSPDDGRTVVMRDRTGKITDRKAYNY